MSNIHANGEWHKLSKMVLKRFKGLCADPLHRHTDKRALNGKILTYAVCVHHIKPVEEYPELLLDESNCIPLCQDCHNLIHKLYNADKSRYFNILLDFSQKKDGDSKYNQKKDGFTEEGLLKNTQEVFMGVGVNVENGVLKL